MVVRIYLKLVISKVSDMWENACAYHPSYWTDFNRPKCLPDSSDVSSQQSPHLLRFGLCLFSVLFLLKFLTFSVVILFHDLLCVRCLAKLLYGSVVWGDEERPLQVFSSVHCRFCHFLQGKHLGVCLQ